MYRCLDCGTEFEMPALNWPDEGEDPIEYCPNCGSDYILCGCDDIDEFFDELEDE